MIQSILDDIKKTNTALNIKEADKPKVLQKRFAETLTAADGGKTFSEEAIKVIADRYRIRSALDHAGAGHIVLEDMDRNTLVVPMRGTEATNNKINDILIADGGNIAFAHVPMAQLVTHLNDISRHMTPKGQAAVQFESKPGLERNQLVRSEQTAEGSGIMHGRKVELYAHSESSIYSTLLSNIYDAQNRDLNGPSANPHEMLGLVNDARSILGKPPVADLKQQQLHYRTTGLDIIAGLNGDLPRENRTLMLVVA